MPCITMHGLIPTNLTPFETYQAYNILDSAVTVQLHPVMLKETNADTLGTYEREKRVQALCLEMSTKGLPTNPYAVATLLYSLEKDADRALTIFNKFIDAIGCRPIKPRSVIDVAYLFYTYLRLPEIRKYDFKTKQTRVSTDAEALETLRDNHPSAAPFVNAILAYREAAKMSSVFKRGLEPGSGLLRCNFSPSGTDTGRLSSQQNPYGRGTNAQNITDRVRQVIVAPDGYCILNFDLKTAESLGVGFISGCRNYIRACQSGDLHTYASKLIWPTLLPWTGELKADKKLAEQQFYRHFSYRDMSKRGGHGSNYYGKAATMAKHLKVPTALITEFQRLYFGEFPEIQEWQLRVIAQIMQSGSITTRLGRQRNFWGRADDPSTHRAAIAFDPQSLIGDVMNEGLVQALRMMKGAGINGVGGIGRKGVFTPAHVDLRAQVHDAGVFIVPIDGVHQIAPMIQNALQYPVDFGPLGTMIIPSDIMIGKTWCKRPKPGAGTARSGGMTKYEEQGLVDYTPGQELHFK